MTLDAVLAVDYPLDHLRVVVVDDGESAETEATVRARQDTAIDLRYVPRQHGGVAGARNLGANQAEEGLIIFVDDDIIVERDHVRAHLLAREETGAEMINGEWEFVPSMQAELVKTAFGRFRLAVEQWVKDRIPKTALDPVRASVGDVTACNLSVSVADFNKLGGFDETFPHAGCEDQDLSLRAISEGYNLVYDRSIRLEHNDRRLDIRDFCERQRRGALTAVVLASKHPGLARANLMLRENAPGPWPHQPGAVLKRLIKSLLATSPGLRIAHAGLRSLERVAPEARVLGRLYWMMTGVYIFAGVRDGFAAASPERRLRLLQEIAGA